MSEAMMMLGAYRFSVSSAAYQQLTRVTGYRWARQECIGTNDALQFTGRAPETIELTGVVFPAVNGSTRQPDLMRLQASLGLPLPLITGTGAVLGLWCVEEIRETQSTFVRGGAPAKQEFTMRLTRYDGGLLALIPF